MRDADQDLAATPSAVDLIADGLDRDEPVRLTIQGRAELVVADPALVAELVDLVDRIETVAILRERIERAQAGVPGVGLDELQQELHRRHGDSF